MKTEEITNIINIVLDGVQNSKIGKIFTAEKDEAGNLKINVVAYNTFLSVLSNLLPKSISGDIEMKQEKEDWQK